MEARAHTDERFLANPTGFNAVRSCFAANASCLTTGTRILATFFPRINLHFSLERRCERVRVRWDAPALPISPRLYFSYRLPDESAHISFVYCSSSRCGGCPQGTSIFCSDGKMGG
jgi:hypothetical protein